MLGNTGVGKSALVQRFCFPLNLPSTTKTVAIECTSRLLKFNNKVYKMQFWDVAGGPQWHALYRRYIYNANVAIVVYDVCDEKSFVDIQYWVDMVRDVHGTNFRIIVIANKIDKSSQRVVSQSGRKTYAWFDNVFLIEASAMTGLHCNEALKIILSMTKEVVTTTVEKPWYWFWS